MSLDDPFWSKVERDTSGCWLWTSAVDFGGYGIFWIGAGVSRRAHRLAYEDLVGPIPDGLTLDHLCRVRRCVNPAPQKPQRGEERMLGAIEDIVRRGRQRGIGCTLVTQRSAVLNKNVLTQAQVMVAMRTIAPQDLAAMDAWIEVHGTPKQRATLMESLPSLPRGDAWVWSPGWPTDEGIFQRVHIDPIGTFVQGDGENISVTEAGIAELGNAYEPLLTGSALLEHWRQKLPAGERAVLEVLVVAYPEAVERDRVGELTTPAYQRSTRDLYLQRLRSRQLVTEPGRGMVRASEALFG